MKKEIVPIIQRTYDKDKYRDLLRRPFAHRGVHNEYPENSLPAFEKAVELNLGIELDIHITTDGKLVVFHDDNLRRMVGVNEYIKLLTYEQVKGYTMGDTEYHIPLLTDVLQLVKGKVPILIEIKTNNDMKRLVPALKQVLENYKGKVFIQSFNPFVLRRCYKAMPNILRGQLSSFFVHDHLRFYKKIPIKKLFFKNFSHADFVSYNLENLPNKYVNKMDIPILAWTVKTEDDYIKAKQNANNMIVDNVDVLK
ncbi:MAG: glycerophosphodiester phosphodiesterase [Clostridia bacterium]|nr:glycerophosphodiester phosphodiesterase [Clostridia bacterium]